MKYSIELFSGSKTVSEVLEKKGFTPVTVDINPKYKPSICCDILDLTPAMLPENPSFIWASPDCTCFSRAGLQSNWQKTTFKYRQYSYKPATTAALLSRENVH